jgi:GTPase SAR1 family protein
MKLNIVVIGDGAVGKDFLCLSYIGSKLPEEDNLHLPLLPEYEKIIEKSDGSEITLGIQ